MENNQKSKKENVVPHKINDSDDVLLEVVDSEDEILSDSSDIVIVESTKTANGAPKHPNIFGSTPNKNNANRKDSLIVIDDSIDNINQAHIIKKPKLEDVIVIQDSPCDKIKPNIIKTRKSLPRRAKNKIFQESLRKKSVQPQTQNTCSIESTQVQRPNINSVESIPSLGDSSSNIGYNVYNPVVFKHKTGLRPIIVDGSNVAMQHGIAIGTRDFSVEGIEICIDYFEKRGHMVKVFIPHFRLASNFSSNPKRLQELENQGKVICTPSRKIRGKTVASYDDRYIIQTAAEFEGVIVSNDNYRDLLYENPAWTKTIEERLLMFTWVQNFLMFPMDPLGRHGPRLEAFLRF
ncbi:endoribonuclease rege-1-like [Ctenocephalides felis]|uniref:endoribonuclease rege-1-like n=1 Tax=Ctenocephalides felis TaxID=7515 RepID=UPI000E6E442E|nr:endoribonuclease rege-1-like [Ctenocephalides felis]